MGSLSPCVGSRGSKCSLRKRRGTWYDTHESHPLLWSFLSDGALLPLTPSLTLLATIWPVSPQSGSTRLTADDCLLYPRHGSAWLPLESVLCVPVVKVKIDKMSKEKHGEKQLQPRVQPRLHLIIPINKN